MVIRTGSGQEATPLTPSAHSKFTVGSERFHPAALGGGSTCAAIVGADLSTFRVTDARAVLPARSTAVPLTT